MKRDAEEFDAFYAASAQRVLGHLSAMTGSRAEAEDAVAEAYARAWDRWASVRECDSPEAWVRRVAYRIAVSAWRKAVNRLRAHRREAAGQQVEATSVDHVAVVSALRRISAEQRRVVVLHHLVGLSVTEIAAEIGCNVNTVKTRLARGRRALAVHLSDDAYETTGGGGQ
ncbi:sigma-70 family RNA polymerase sigma factor [Verrucosispora sp. WMMA2044]|uniref:Sigma-70 family RNA polymerase sigma factor n=1 Tax=Verrucosispora sioxanthis TaxID=2499994 RepID=A0A6M1L4K2_9ACTN|nr:MULTISPECIES: sigma-70 family RNA polymerase sigma factor [Micromonospora]NEE64110.1 sigma-70 family RNA polymerase sigma factor [Verrucosispora sioxanthis]NGM13220.1 sigma-70 family RNA polymerase sigma factor [Verrucosispora sioxanthis]WBB51181.1 sigma-70 family RNA polymerase sigma factor [Verrucosispora sp. WMMA2044]